MTNDDIFCQNENIDFSAFVRIIRRKLTAHHELYSMAPKAEYWEELLHRSLMEFGMKTDWKPDSNHKSGKDMVITESAWGLPGERISCKTGQTSGGTLKISGSRLTKHKTLKEKIKFISDKKEDSYALLSKEKGCDERHYKLILFPSSLLDYGSATWRETTRNKHGNLNFAGTHEVFNARIEASCSDQLWTLIPDYEKNPSIQVFEIKV